MTDGMSRLMTAATGLVAQVAAVDGEDAGQVYARTVQALLHLVRRQVGMELAWISEFAGDVQTFRFVDADDGVAAPQAGDRGPLSGTYCARAMAGALPSLIPDMRTEPAAEMLDGIRNLDVGAYVGVSLHDPAGLVVGRLCAVAGRALPTLTERDMAAVRLVADLVEDLTQRLLATDDHARRLASTRERLQAIIAGGGRLPVVQPIVDLRSGSLLAVEALTRFSDERYNVAQWFDVAGNLGLRGELEIAVAQTQLDLLLGPDAPPAVAVNLSPETILRGGVDRLLGDRNRDPKRIIVEITEHAPVEDYAALEAALSEHRARGLRVAIDDVGAGYANLAHIVSVHPDLVKIDISLVHGVAEDVVRQALVTALVNFAPTVGAVLVAEGVESEADLRAVESLGVGCAQGYAVGLPASWPFA